MATNTTLDLGAYMSNSIRNIMAKAYKSVLSNPREAKFAYRMQTFFQKSEKRRRKMLSELAEAFNDDYPTKKLIEKWIDGEKEHMAWEAQYLNYIDKLGYENFLTAMM